MSSAIIIFLASKLYIAVVVIGALTVVFLQKEVRKRAVLLALLVLPVSYSTAKMSSHFFYNPRPFVVGDFVPLIQHAADNGFPSDHTLLTATLASIVFVYNKPVGAFLFGVALAVGLGRVLAGVHHLADVIGSIVIAVVTTYLVTILLRRFLK